MRLLRYPELGPLKGIDYSREYIRRLVKLKKFPAPIRRGKRGVAWLEDELDAHVETMVEARDRSAEERAR